MLQNHATLGDIRKYLQKEVSQLYSGGEINALVNMIMDYCGYPSPGPILNPQHQPGANTVAQINEIVTDIHTHRPIQYILGETSFLDVTIHIDENALIPRPETEELVYRIIHSTKHPPLHILDLCTGSGCIALALKNEFPSARVSGLDNSIRALELARKNGEMNQLEVNWIQGDILSLESTLFPVKYDLVVCNPPYVLMSEKTLMERNVLDYEPHAALFVEDHDPLVFYSAIARLSPEILPESGTLWLEINERFGREVSGLLEDSGFTQIIIYKDIHEKERFIKARI
ncbi:MAG: peptide chain release factor N(5)-glutamine methyltransferase [Bacteroidales bacterium]